MLSEITWGDAEDNVKFNSGGELYDYLIDNLSNEIILLNCVEYDDYVRLDFQYNDLIYELYSNYDLTLEFQIYDSNLEDFGSGISFGKRGLEYLLQ